MDAVIGGLGIVVYEAMSTGLPVIVSDGDVIIRHGIDGLVSPPRDIKSLKENIIRLYRDKDLREKLAQNALIRVRDFDWDTYHRKVGDAYVQILSKHNSMGIRGQISY
jgi:glycosyltransferase involved in cell wall biosynthesis